MHYGGENWGKLEKEWSDFDPNELDLAFGVPDYGAKFYQNLVKIATVGEVTEEQTDRQTDVTDAGDFIICTIGVTTLRQEEAVASS